VDLPWNRVGKAAVFQWRLSMDHYRESRWTSVQVLIGSSPGEFEEKAEEAAPWHEDAFIVARPSDRTDCTKQPPTLWKGSLATSALLLAAMVGSIALR
jgi:hypothetical protein